VDDIPADVDAFFRGQVPRLNGKPSAVDVAVFGRKFAAVQAALARIVESKYREQAGSRRRAEHSFRRQAANADEAGVMGRPRNGAIDTCACSRIGVEQRLDINERNLLR
jgi:hypothetical protein